ncbi:MAG: bifunctional hydroxymethylpyrimidine kinase/phosphomethylpyrimidine kinase [Planctomycetes bacterium]|nr:bifunctional hydroxymethylpyrimidine kinase/phosphomethylpyrimidine kinase [Planctomycetota bacterium]
MIVAAGLTPAWQQVLLLDGLRIGEVNRAREAHWCASGKVLNVGLALHHLGGPSLTLALAGGPGGEGIDLELAALGVPRRLVWSKSPTRVCTTLLDPATETTTELVENAAPVAPGEIASFIAAYEEAAKGARMAVLSGSLPAGTPSTFYRDLAARTPGRVVLDARGPELLEALPLRPLCAKPNREELGRTFGRELRSDAELREAMEEVNRLGAEWVVVSQGKGALWATSAGRLQVFEPARVRTVNPIGCGDCLAAGIAWAADRGMDMPEAIRFGMAAAAENAAALLPARLDLARVRRRMEDVARLG